jgi:hypothetical protein
MPLNIQLVDIRDSIEEIVELQIDQAKLRNVSIQIQFKGFPF